MTLDLLLAFAVYAFVTSITPGPNNAMLLASGVNHGLARTVPHLLGVCIGFTVMVLAVGSGLGTLFLALPGIHVALRWVGAVYLLWLAWKIATSGDMDGETSRARPLTFLQAAAFQWVNPKAWIMAVGAVVTYTPTDGALADVLILAVVFGLVNAPCITIWAGLGDVLRRYLTDLRHIRAFNAVMAGLLVLSLWPLLIDGVR